VRNKREHLHAQPIRAESYRTHYHIQMWPLHIDMWLVTFWCDLTSVCDPPLILRRKCVRPPLCWKAFVTPSCVVLWLLGWIDRAAIRDWWKRIYIFKRTVLELHVLWLSRVWYSYSLITYWYWSAYQMVCSQLSLANWAPTWISNSSISSIDAYISIALWCLCPSEHDLIFKLMPSPHVQLHQRAQH
jgi:hypothetical protein